MQSRGQVIEGFRLSPQQNRVWQLQQGSQAYVTQCAILIEGDVESEALEEALRKIMRKHEILRTTLDWLPGLNTPIQLILEAPPLPLRKANLSDKKPEELELAVSALLKEEARPFDLKRGILVRFCLSRLSASRQVLLVSLHSMCGDSWTLKNFFKQISRHYAAELAGQEAPDAPAQYLQFSEWQNELLEEAEEESGNRGQEVSYLAADLALPLESDPARGSESSPHTFSPESNMLVLDSSVTERIESIGNAHNSSVSGFLLACWQILLWRLSGEEEVLVKCLFDGRQFEDLHDAFGLFASYLPARGFFRRSLRFHEAVERATSSLQQAQDSQERFLRLMAGGKAPKRTDAVSFEYEDWPEAEQVRSVKFSYWKQYCCIDSFKLKLGGYRKPESLTIEIQYDPGIFSREYMELIQERYLTLIEAAISNPQALIGDIEVVGRRERERLLETWNNTERELTDSRCFHELIAGQARVSPEAIAVVYKQECLSYGELERRANQLANHLRALGAEPDCVAGLYLKRSLEMIIGLLGIVKAGAAYLPLEVGQPVGRLDDMLEYAGAGMVVTMWEVAGSLPAGRREVVMLDRDWERIDGYSRIAPEVNTSPENLAYVIYTSGSTGKPKGVMVRHGSVSNLLEGLEKTIYEGEGKGLSVSMNASSAFDASVKQVIQLGRGRKLFIVPEEDRIDAAALLDYLVINNIEALDCTPSQLKMLIDAGLG
jgi:non-ribosomal peptide synthetase component F